MLSTAKEIIVLLRKRNGIRDDDFTTPVSLKVHAPSCDCRYEGKRTGFRGLVVVPDLKSTCGLLYVCREASAKSYERNSSYAESVLAEKLFAAGFPIKVRMSICMLRKGFTNSAALFHGPLSDIATLIQIAERCKNVKDNLYHDHAENLRVFSLKGMMTRRENEEPKLILKHHIKTALMLIKNRKAVNIAVSLDDTYMIAMANQDDKKEGWCEIDLPGGKKDLGKSSWDTLVRECEEETSIRLRLSKDGGPSGDILDEKGDAALHFEIVCPAEHMHGMDFYFIFVQSSKDDGGVASLLGEMSLK